ncbi:MAG: GntR family transcriptional regulator [Anaerolineae bacterium]|nr:GntR family transcriptional regulator [Anaerolineae bacterium]
MTITYSNPLIAVDQRSSGKHDKSNAWRTIYDRLKADILSRTIKPGQALTEAELAKDFQVSRTPVREALNLLEKEGLIQRISRRGYIVTELSLEDVLDLIELRIILEREAVRLAAIRRGAETAAELERLNNAGFAGELPLLEVDREYHRTIAHASGNRQLAEVLEMVLDKSMRLELSFISSFNPDQVLWGHAETIAALRRADPDEAARSVQEGFYHFEDMLLRRSRPNG